MFSLTVEIFSNDSKHSQERVWSVKKIAGKFSVYNIITICL